MAERRRVSADICQKHQSVDTSEDPCLYCLLEFIRKQAEQGKKQTELKPMKALFDTIYQGAKNRLSLRLAVNGGRK
jgi:hypothetical protein